MERGTEGSTQRYPETGLADLTASRPESDIQRALDDVERFIETHPVNTDENPYFRMIRAQKGLAKRQIAAVAADWLYGAKEFPKSLGYLFTRVATEEARSFLANILDEELGSARTDHIHYKLLERTLRAIGIPDEEIRKEPTLSEAIRHAGWLRSVFKEAPLLEALGTIWAVEKHAYAMIYYVNEGIGRFGLREEEREYFTLHLEIEKDDHPAMMRSCVIQHLSSQEDVPAVRAGALDYLNSVEKVWRQYYSETHTLFPD